MKHPEASFCSFCGRDRKHASLLIQAGPVAICESCTGLCSQIVVEHFTGLKVQLKTIRFEDGPQAAAEAPAQHEPNQDSSAPPGGQHRMANPEPCVGPAENPDERLLTDQTGGTGRADDAPWEALMRWARDPSSNHMNRCVGPNHNENDPRPILIAEWTLRPEDRAEGDDGAWAVTGIGSSYSEAARDLCKNLGLIVKPKLTPEEMTTIAAEVRADYRAAKAEAQKIGAELDEWSRTRAKGPSTNRQRAQELLQRIRPLFPIEYWEPNITSAFEEALNEAEARGQVCTAPKS